MAPFRFLFATPVSTACTLCGLWLALWTASSAHAQQVIPPSRIESVRGLAMGSGVRASAVGTHAQAANVANLVQGGLYHLEAFAQYDPTTKLTSLGGAVADSMTSKLGAGFSMRGLVGDNSAGDHGGYDGRLGLAYPLVEAFSIGLGLRYANMHVSNPDALDEDPDPEVVDQRYRLKHFTLDAAFSLHVGALTLSGLGYNLIDTGSPLAPTQAGGSASYAVSETFILGGDLLVDVRSFDKPKVLGGGGLELLLGESFPLRAGYQYDQGRHRHAVTAGLGYVDEIIGVQASVRQHFGDFPETNLMFALQYFVR